MKIGIIVYSHTGHTYLTAQRLKENLSKKENSVNVEKIKATGDIYPGSKNIKIETMPETDKYDLILFGAPVWAFSLSSVMETYLSQIKSLGNKKIICFVTKSLPFYWTGGNQAIARMKKLCESKEGNICGSEILIWSDKNRDNRIAEKAEEVVKSL